MQMLLEELFPVHRSLTGAGNRETLATLGRILPDLEIFEVPSRTPVYDWEIPLEWKVRHAYITDKSGRKILDYLDNNLHIVQYSQSFYGKLTKQELMAHLHFHPQIPNAIPYVTSYYRKTWGFCVTKKFVDELSDSEIYEVVIDAEHFLGSMTWGQIYLPGKSTDEVIFSTYICHPSMANNELSGPLVSAALVQSLLQLKERRFSYRFLFIPETIGALYFISENYPHLKENVKAVFVLTCLGDNRKWSYVQGRTQNTYAERLLETCFREQGIEPKRFDYLQRGSDERQFGSPGIDLPVVAVSRSKFGDFPEYHSSLDNLDLVSGENLIESASVLFELIRINESNVIPVRETPGEPFLTKYNLRQSIENKRLAGIDAVLSNLIAYSDGKHDLIELSKITGVKITELYYLLNKLVELKILSIK